MKIKESLAYMALGWILVFSGMILSNFTPVANAQLEQIQGLKMIKDLVEEFAGSSDRNQPKGAKIDTLYCRQIQIIDNEGNTRIHIGPYSNEISYGVVLMSDKESKIIEMKATPANYRGGDVLAGQFVARNGEGEVVFGAGSRTYYSNEKAGDGYIKLWDDDGNHIHFER